MAYSVARRGHHGSERTTPRISRTVMPRAYIETIFSSKPRNRRLYRAISLGSNVPLRSRGMSSRTCDVSSSTVFGEEPLRRFGLPSTSSAAKCSSNSAFRMRSESAFFSSSSRPSRTPPVGHDPPEAAPAPLSRLPCDVPLLDIIMTPITEILTVPVSAVPLPDSLAINGDGGLCSLFSGKISAELVEKRL